MKFSSALGRIEKAVIKSIPNIKISHSYLKEANHVSKLIIQSSDAQIKIEPNFILRGTVYPVQRFNLCQSAKNLFKQDVRDVLLLSFADLYAGKICAVLNRQHPRDLIVI